MIDSGSIFVLVLSAGILLVIFYLIKQVQQTKIDLQNQVNQLQQNISQRFDANTQNLTGHLGIITNQMGSTSNLVAQMEGKLGQMQEAGRHIMDLAKQITSLQEILSSPKMRGGLGEFFLGDLLAQCIPASSYREQYSFRSANKVDAAVFLGEKILCIDAKFPLENFRRIFQTESEDEKKNLRKVFLQDVKKHVNAIAEKYILPDENTLDFALMYIPAENVYYELIVREDSNLYEHCLSKKVIPVSPNTFYAYLQVILMGLRGFQISEQAKSILGQLQQIQNDLERFDLDFSKIGLHLRNADKSFEAAEGRLQRLKDKVASMGTTEIEGPSPALISASETLKEP